MVNQQINTSGTTFYTYGLAGSDANSFGYDGLQVHLRGKGADVSYILPGMAQSLFYNQQRGGGTSVVYVNGVQQNSGANGGTFVNRVVVGEKGGGGSNGEIKIQEFILYVDQDQTSNKTEIENNINAYYSIY